MKNRIIKKTKTNQSRRYRSEMLKLLASDDVPIEWRRLYTICMYSGPRAGELLALTLTDAEPRVVH